MAKKTSRNNTRRRLKPRDGSTHKAESSCYAANLDDLPEKDTLENEEYF
jgi:hypothetical protein